MPDGKTTQEKNFTYEVSKNGEYAFEYTDLNGNTGIKLIHVQNIQNRKETKVPKVTVLNGKIKLESDDEIEYSLDNNKWNNYTQEIEYKSPVYARVKNEKYECSVLKITIDEEGHLDLKNTEERKIEEEILTNGIGIIKKGYKKIINYEKEVSGTKSEDSNEQNKSLFKYISQIADDIIYTFSLTDGKYAGCHFGDRVTEITYKEMDNSVSNIKGDNYSIKSDNDIEYSVFYEEEGYISLENSTESIEKEKVESGKIKSYRKDHASWGGEVGWVETYAKYAYVDSKGNLVSNIDFINKFNEFMASKNENKKYIKILGDGTTFYILTELGEVYRVTYTAQTNEVDYIRDGFGIEHEVLVDLEPTGGYYYNTILKLYLRNIVNIYDSATALTKDGKIVSLIKNDEEATSVVQELQSQTDKYLMVSHLGLKDGKLYNFDDVKKGIEVTAGKLVESEEAKFGTYSESNKTIRLFSSVYDAESYKLNDEVYIDVQKSDDILPEFVDITEYRNSKNKNSNRVPIRKHNLDRASRNNR